MSKQDQRLKNMLHIGVVIYIVTLLYAFYDCYQNKDMVGIGMGVVAMITPWFVPLIFRIKKYQPVYEIYIMNLVFVYFASLVGSTLHGYQIPGFDKALHFSSGILLTLAAILLFMIIKKVKHIQDENDYQLFLVFINAVNVALAAIWEFYEYAMLIFFNNDCINHYSQGVHDAMTDMICAMVAGWIVTYFVIRAYKKQKTNFIVNLCEKFYERNLEQ